MILSIAQGLLLEILDSECASIVVLFAIVFFFEVSLASICISYVKVRMLLHRLLHGGKEQIWCFELIFAASCQNSLRVVLACKNRKVSLSELKGTILEHSDLVKSLTSFVRERICVPNTIFVDS